MTGGFMRYAKQPMRAFKGVLLAAMAVGLAGCMKPREAQPESLVEVAYNDNNIDVVAGDFSILEIKGGPATVTQYDGWGFPLIVNLSYRICLQHSVTKSSIKGQPFTVRVSDKEVPGGMRTDQSGCAVVADPEPIGFNILAQENFIKRTITVWAKPGSGQTGYAQRVVAINPWTKTFGTGFDQVTDLKYSPTIRDVAVPEDKTYEALQGSYGDGPQNMAKLQVRQLSYRTNQGGFGESNQVVQTSVSFRPVLVPTDYNGRPLPPLKITEGTVGVALEVQSVPRREDDEPNTLAAFFTVRDESERATALGQASATVQDSHAARTYIVPGTIVDGEVQVQGFLDFVNRIDEGQVQAVLSVLPSIDSGPAGLGEFVGIYNIDSFTRAATNVSGVALVRDISGEIHDPERDPRIPLPGTSLAPGVNQVFPFQFSQMELRFLMYAEGETATKRSVYFKVRTRVYNPLTKAPVPNEVFNVTPLSTSGMDNDLAGALADPALDFEGTTISTDSEGWLEWTDRISHQYYRKEQYFVRTVRVTHPESDFSGDLEMIINPWDFTWTFGFDSRLQTGQFVKRLIDQGAIEDREPSVFYEPDYRWEAIGFRYSIDKFLTLTIKKRMQLSLYPKALRYNSLTLGRNAIQPVRDGVYLMKLALRNNYFVDYFASEPIEDRSTEYISVIKKLVGVQNGKIVTPVEFGVRDYRLMRFRSQFFVELAPVDLDMVNPETGERYIPDVDKEYIKAVMLGTRERPYEMDAETRLDEKLRQQVGDLDNLIDFDAGIAPRTFVAPLVPLSNVFASTMRPVDTMEEIYCRYSTCNEIQSDIEVAAEYERAADLARSRLYQDATDVAVAQTTVTDLINRWYILEDQYRDEMEERSKLVNYLLENNLEFVQIQDPSTLPVKITDEEIRQANQVYADDPVEGFLQDFNRTVNQRGEGPSAVEPAGRITQLPEVTTTEFIEFITNQTASDHLLRRTCAFFFENVFGEQEIFDFARETIAYRSMINKMVSECILRMHRNDPNQTVFSYDRKLKIYETSSFEEMGGVSINLNTNTNFSVARGESYTSSQAWNVNVGVNARLGQGDALSTLLRRIPLVGSFVVPDINISGGAGRSWSWADSQFSNVNEGMNYNDGLLFVSQQKYINIAFSKFERCTILKMTPEFIDSVGLVDFVRGSQYRFRGLTLQESFAALTRGVMICSGNIEDEETWFREAYYYFTQHFVEGDLLDSADPKNHPWLLTLRGLNDYRKFLSNFTDLKLNGDSQSTPLGNPNGLITPREVPYEFQMGERPIKALEAAYRATNLSSPGFYTVTEDSLNINSMF